MHKHKKYILDTPHDGFVDLIEPDGISVISVSLNKPPCHKFTSFLLLLSNETAL